MININKIVNDSLVKLEEEKFVEGVVQKRLEKTIAEIVDDIFKEYSDFGKNLKQHIQKGLNINFENLGIEGYNMLVLKAIQEQLDKTITIQGIQKIKETTKEMLSDIKEEYTLSEIIETLKNQDLSEEWEHDEDDEVTLIIEKSCSRCFTHIYLDEENNKKKYECKYQVDFDNEGKPYSISLDNKILDTNKVLLGLHGLDELLFKIYAHGSRIVLDQGDDPEDYDMYYREEY